jgi:hypothetical protein
MMKKEIERVFLIVYIYRKPEKVRGYLFHKKLAPIILCLEIDYQVIYYNSGSIHKTKQLTTKVHNTVIKQKIN